MRVERVEHVSAEGNVETVYDRTAAEGATKVSVTPNAVLRRVCDIDRRDLRWLWPARVPLGKLTLFAGDPGLGRALLPSTLSRA
jgi:hypothetical protein